jgi:ABC-type spermidine/putrescine transport system permease subunit I
MMVATAPDSARRVEVALRLGGIRRVAAAVPNLAWAALFFLVPFAVMILYSVSVQDPITAQIHYTLSTSNYARIDQPLVLGALLRSLSMSAIATVLCVVLGYPVAYFIAHWAGRWKPLFLVMVIVPFWMSFVIRTYAWLGLLGPQGQVNDILKSVGLISAPLPLAYHPIAIVIGIVYNYLPIMIFPLFVALDRIDHRVIEASRDLGATSRHVFTRVIFPQSLPGLVAGVIVVAVPATGEYVVPAILGGGKTLMLGNVIQDQFGLSFAWPFGAALATAMTGLLLVFIAITVRVAARMGMEQIG